MMGDHATLKGGLSQKREKIVSVCIWHPDEVCLTARAKTLKMPKPNRGAVPRVINPE